MAEEDVALGGITVGILKRHIGVDLYQAVRDLATHKHADYRERESEPESEDESCDGSEPESDDGNETCQL